MIRTYGLTHVALAVRDLGRSSRFYQSLLGAKVVHPDASVVQLQTPGSRDVIVLERRPQRAGAPGGVVHFGFRLWRAADIGRAIEAVRDAGGRVKEHGEFVPGEPYVFGASAPALLACGGDNGFAPSVESVAGSYTGTMSGRTSSARSREAA